MDRYYIRTLHKNSVSFQNLYRYFCNKYAYCKFHLYNLLYIALIYCSAAVENVCVYRPDVVGIVVVVDVEVEEDVEPVLVVVDTVVDVDDVDDVDPTDP